MNAFNPAYAGSEGRVLSFTTRSTWQGVSGAPKMNYFYFSGNPRKNLAFGLSIINNKVFIDERTLYSLDASYQLTVGAGKTLSLGIKAGAHTKFTDVEAIQRLTNIPTLFLISPRRPTLSLDLGASTKHKSSIYLFPFLIS